MLIQLSIRDFAIIEKLELHFQRGMTVLTGETGAGKSILVGALGLLLGDRADNTVIRRGCERADLAAVFETTGNTALSELLVDQDIPYAEEELLLRRVISADGRSRAWINGAQVTAQVLREAGECLVDIHGQHAHQSLTRREVQRQLLDDYGNHSAQLSRLKAVWQNWQEITRKLADLSRGGMEHNAAMELLRYQLTELETLRPGPVEYQSLNEELRLLANASRLLETAQQTAAVLREEEHSVDARLHAVLAELRELEHLDSSLAGINQLLEEAAIRISEAADELRGYAGRHDLDPGRLQEVELRLSRLHEMARKHRIKPGELYQHLALLQQRLAAMEDTEAGVEALGKAQVTANAAYREAAIHLHTDRVQAAAAMAEEVSMRIRQLGMPHGQFEIHVEEDDEATPHPWGMDQVDYLVNINPGQGLQALRKVASGGELSRISLAIQVSSRDQAVPCLVFDEVDAGIGGGVAEITGGLLHALADQRQVLCVTHLPQVAAQADHHLLVEKSSDTTSTITRVRELEMSARIEEIARMLGGLRVTARSRDHAREMLGKRAASG